MLCARFSFLLLWCSHIGNHPEEDLTKFGYKIGRIVKSFVVMLMSGDLQEHTL
jgi:hypothetical protein